VKPIVVDRIEGDRAIVEWAGGRIDLPLAMLPEGTCEGDTLHWSREPGNSTDAEARLQRLKSKTPQGPGRIDL